MANVLGAIPIDVFVLLFTLFVSLLTGVLFGMAPAMRSSRMDLEGFMREGGRASSSASHRLLGGLVIAEVALALVLLAGAGLLIRNFERLHGLELGYESDALVTLSVSLDGSPKYESAESKVQFVRQVEEQLEAVSGVDEVGATCIFPPVAGISLPPLRSMAGPSRSARRSSLTIA